MIEATCSACGTLNRVSEANVPVGTKFITCADCKSRVAISLPAPALPPLPRLPPPIPSAARAPAAADLPDLPAPKRPSALPRPATPPARAAQAPARPAPRSGLAAALDPELPAPKVTRSAMATLDFDDASAASPASAGIIDLPAPKRSSPRAPAAEPTRDDIVDLLAPKLERAEPDLPAPRSPRRAAPDPAAPGDAARVATRETVARPAPPDLAPARGPRIADLPAPRGPDAAARAPSGDPPTAGALFDDVPQPRSRERADLPAPKGFFEDLPQPKAHPSGEITDVPAPKGFFEDLPQPKAHPTGGIAEVPAPKGYFEDIPGLPNTSRPEVPAPKGYFEDIPGLPSTSRPEVPAPKGYFEDIPGLPSTPRPEAPAPKGFFDDIPGLPSTPRPDATTPGLFDDLPSPGRSSAGRSSAGHGADGGGDLQLEAGPELQLTPPAPGAAVAFDELELSRPSAPVRFDAPTRPSAARPGPSDLRGADAGLVLELEGGPPRAAGRAIAPAPPEARRPGPAEAPGRPGPAEAPARGRRGALLLGGLILAGALAGGGFVLYRRHVQAVERQAVIAAQLADARAAYAANDPGHWRRAAAAARRVVELDDANPDALGIGAESLLASALADGTGAASKIAQAHAMLDTANSGGISTPVLARARALAALAARQPDTALTQLQPLATRAPQDGALALYVGWALAARGELAGASQAFERAMATPAVKLAALYGRGNARLELADLDGARADFTAVLELAGDHIGAQVGLAAARPPSAASRESDLLAILARKDVDAADPRAVTRAWTLAGDAAMRAGRYDVARERFRKALAVSPQDLAATAGLAETELRDGKIPAAAELTARALAVSKDDVAAQLVQSEIEIKQRRLQLAGQRLAALAGRAPPLPPLEQARLQLVLGKLLEAQGKHDEAADAYVAGARLARALDLEPMIAAVDQLAALTTAAIADRDGARADVLRNRTDELLSNFAEQAARDPHLALTLGVGYLQAGNPDKAEPWLRHAVDALPQDAEARFQLGRALRRSAHPEDALEVLRAASGLDPARSDIAAELARTYEALGQDADAGALYARLLAGADPGIELRARAGRFFARTGAPDKAAEQGAKILAAEPRNPAGLYLKGTGLLAAGKALEARQQFQRAVEVDRDPEYLDALGRAAEAIAQGGDREAQELALRSYAAAAEAAPGMLNPLVGQGRIYVTRREAAKAVPPLLAASRLARSAEVMFLLGAAYQDSQQPAVARQWLEEAVRIAPSPEAYWRLGQLERDANRGPQAVAALASATRMGAEAEKRTGTPIVWLTDAFYLEGRIHLDLHNEPAARAAWRAYVARNPPPSAQLTEVKQLLATILR